MTVIENKARTRVVGLVALLMYLAGLFTMQDFAEFRVLFHEGCVGQTCGFTWPAGLSTLSTVLRMARTLLCGVLVLWIRPDLWLDQKDRTRLLIAFAFAALGDFFLIFGGTLPGGIEIVPPGQAFMMGVAAFLVCHGVLIWRHLVSFADFRSDLQRPGVAPKVWGLLAASFVPTIAAVVLTWPYLKPAMDLPYMLILTLSLWMALTVIPRKDDFPRVNRALIAGGLGFFYLCDVCLGLGVRLQDAMPLASEWIGQVPNLSYSWALIALALSGYDWLALMGREEDDNPALSA